MAEPGLNKIMTGLEVKIELMKRGIKLANIADLADVTRPAVTRTLSYDDSYQCEQVIEQIARVLGMERIKIVKKPKKQRKNKVKRQNIELLTVCKK